MSVPKELMDVVSQGGGGPAPGGGPMSTPNPMEGLQTEALININMVIDMLAKAIPAFGPQTEEGKAVTNAMKSLVNAFGKDRQQTAELIPAQLQSLLQTIPNPTGQPLNKMSPVQPAVPQGATA